MVVVEVVVLDKMTCQNIWKEGRQTKEAKKLYIKLQLNFLIPEVDP